MRQNPVKPLFRGGEARSEHKKPLKIFRELLVRENRFAFGAAVPVARRVTFRSLPQPELTYCRGLHGSTLY